MKIDDALPYILSDMPSCPAPLAIQHLILAAQEFCRGSRCWREELDPEQLKDGVREYDLMPSDSQGKVFIVDRVECLGYGLLGLLDATQRRPHDWSTAKANLPTSVRAAEDMQTLQVYPLPAGQSLPMLQVTVRLIPKLTATAMPDSVLERYIDALSSGTKARLMVMSNRPWSDPAMAAYHLGVFSAAIEDARATAENGGVMGSVYVTPPRFG